MRVVLLGPTASGEGGIAAHQRRMAAALEAAGHDVHRVGLTRVYPSWAGVPPSVLGENELPLDALAAASWSKLGDQVGLLKPDALLFQYWHPLCAGAYRHLLGRFPEIVRLIVVHNAEPHEWFPGARRVLAGLLKAVDGVLVHSEAVFRALPAFAPRVCEALPALLALGGASKPAEAADLKGAFVLLPGPQRRYKGASLAVKAMEQAGRAAPVTMVVAGTARRGGPVRLLSKQGQYSGILYWNRYFRDPEFVWLLMHCSALVLPYTQASQSGWPAAARLLGTPVIATATGGLPEQLGGEAATFVAGGDVRGLATAIQRAALGAPRRSRDPGQLEECERLALGEWKQIAETIEQLVDRARPSRARSGAPTAVSVFPEDDHGMLEDFH